MKPSLSHPPRPAKADAQPIPPAASEPAATDLDHLLQRALAHHRAGELPQAEALYRQILTAHPAHLDATHLLGVLTCQAGHFALAVELADQAIALNPNLAEPHGARGNGLYGLKQYSEALASFDRALELKPTLTEAWNDRGNALFSLGRYAEAVASFDRALELHPDFAAALANRGNARNSLGQFVAAISDIDAALALNPNFAEAHSNRGNALFCLQQYQQAVASFDRALELRPAYVEAHANRGSALLSLGRHAEAIASFDRALELQPEHFEAWCNRGNALNSLNQPNQALASFDRALRIHPDFAEAYANRGTSYYALGQLQQALQDFDHAIALRPNFGEAHSNRTSVLYRLELYSEALLSIDRALQIDPSVAAFHNNRSIVLHGLRRFPESLASSDQALALDPDFAEAHGNRGNALLGLEQFQDALACYDQCILLKPDYANAHSARGSALQGLGQSEAALASLDRAIELDPNFMAAYVNRGNVHQALRQYHAALMDFERSIALQPQCDYLLGMMLHMKRYRCDWDGIGALTSEMEARILRGERACIPFSTLSVTSSLAIQQQAGQILVREKYPDALTAAAIPPRAPHDKIRIGYYSADFRIHAVAYLMAGVFEHHDPQRFEIFAFSFGPNVHDEMTARIAAAFNTGGGAHSSGVARFFDVRTLSEQQTADLSRELGIDIAVDLTGFTEHYRSGIFAQRAAPIQVSYLGYPGSMGADFIDYLIADSTVVPVSARPFYTEKIIELPNSFQANTPLEPSSKTYTRAEEGLPEAAFVFCCFNNTYKISPDTFAVWMRILAAVPNSVLWLLQSEPATADNLRAHAESAGIKPDRLVFALRLPLDEHLNRQRLADLFLDTLPFNAGATASPALASGLPILTCMGPTFAGRMAASLLRAVGLPELITENYADYEALAIALALDPIRYRALREKLAHNLPTAPLFDTAATTRNLEAAYTAIHIRQMAGLPPAPITIAESVPPA